jgi:hypothetical protein
MALGTFNGSTFKDLSGLVPEQQDAILYTNAWNGRYWLVGGGYEGAGVLFTFDGSGIVDLTTKIRDAIRGFVSVQALAWNGEYWLIGGIGFLAEYDGRNFTDLTQQLTNSLSMPDFYTVNAIAWNGRSWMIGGGVPIAQVATGNAWLVSNSSVASSFSLFESNLLTLFLSRARFISVSILGESMKSVSFVSIAQISRVSFRAVETTPTPCPFLFPYLALTVS